MSAATKTRGVAQAIISGSVPLLEGVRLILPHLHADESICTPSDRKLFIGIGSETDNLPLGPVRKDWHPDSLPEKDRQIAEYTERVREVVTSACWRILRTAPN